MSLRFASVLIVLAAATAHARPAVPPEVAKLYESRPTIELVTMGIGSLIWERHGHIAMCVRYENPKDDRCYNYGIGDFHAPVKMAWGFFRGANSFWVGKDTPENMLQIYKYFDRTIWVQPLPLDDDQKQKVIMKLEHDILDENRYYAYDHFEDNCTTRIRDIIDDVTHGALSSMRNDPTDGKTFRDLARDGFAGMRLPLLITDIAMGRSTDRVPTYWDRMFLPQFLREAVAKKFGIQPIPIYERSECRRDESAAIAEHRDPDPNCAGRGILTVPNPPSGRVWFALLILVLTAPAWATRKWGRFQRTGLAFSVIPYALLGTILTFLAIISPLPYVHIQETCLLWLPFDFAVLFLSPVRVRKYARFRVGMLAVFAALMIINVLHQPLFAPLLWPLVPMAVVGFWPAKPAK